MNNRQRTHSENNDAGAGTGRLAGWALAGALCLGANIVPMMVFVGLAIRHPGEYAYLLPLVMFFASARSVVFALQGIGSIENLARIALASLAFAAMGVAIALFGELRHPLWSVGAVLAGCGMGAYAPMFRTVRDGLADESIPFNNRHLARTKMFSTGAVVAQGVVLVAVSASAMLAGDNALSAFVCSQGDAANAVVFACALPVCLAVSAAGMAVAFPRRGEAL